MTNILTPEVSSNEVVNIPLNALRNIRTLFPMLSEYATRELDNLQVSLYANSDLSSMPPIQVVETDNGIGVLDGYHRWAAKERQVILQVLQVPAEATEKDRQKAINDMSAEQKQAVEAVLCSDDTTIPAVFGAYASVQDINVACLTYNLKNGLQPKGKARAEMAVDYYLITRDVQPKAPTQAAVAAIFGITPPTLNEYLKKREKAMKAAEAEAEAAGNETEDPGQSEEDVAAEKYLKKVDRFIEGLQDMYEESPAVYAAAIQKLFAPVLIGMHDINADNDIPTYGENIRTALAVAPDVDASQLFYVEKLHRGISEWVKKSSAAAKKATKKVPAKKAADTEATAAD